MGIGTYWRLRFDGQSPYNGNSYINIATLEMHETVGGADACTGGTATADSAYSTNVAGNAFDGNTSTYWESNSGSTTRWLQYQFSSSKTIVEYKIKNGPFAGEAPLTWFLEYSNDGSTWTIKHVVRMEPAWTAGEIRTYTVDYGHTNLYWRLNISATSGATSYANIGELEMHTTVGGANQCTGGAGFADSYNSPRTVARGFDGNTSNDWESLGTGGPWYLGYRFASDITIVEYKVTAGAFASEAPKNWTLEYSGDGASWTVADTQTNQTGWSSGQTRTFSFGGSPKRPVVCACT